MEATSAISSVIVAENLFFLVLFLIFLANHRYLPCSSASPIDSLSDSLFPTSLRHVTFVFVSGNETSPMCHFVFAAYPGDSTATTYAHMVIAKPDSSFRSKGKVQYWDRTKRGVETSVSESAPIGGAVVGFEAVPLTILSVFILIFLHLL